MKIHDNTLGKQVFVYPVQIPRSKILLSQFYVQKCGIDKHSSVFFHYLQLKTLDIYYIFKKHKKSIKGGIKKTDQLVISEHK